MNNQPVVCAGPSEIMSQYFAFQNEIMAAVLWSKIAEKRFETQRWTKRLFAKGVLDLWKDSPTSLDLVANSVFWNLISATNSSLTSAFLISLSFASVLYSNTAWLWILVKDRVVVRDYKTMLDIETSWIELAFFLSQTTNLANKVNDDKLPLKLNEIIKKYQQSWLFATIWAENKIGGQFRLMDLMSDMIVMNGHMRHFLMYNNTWILDKYRWCVWEYDNVWVSKKCTNGPILKFSDEAIAQLDQDYSQLGMFWKCNLYVSSFTNTISKWIKNNFESVEAAMQDVKNSVSNLKNTLFNSSRWDLAKDRCNMSYYEMAQLRAYWWWDWNCSQSLVDVDFDSDLLDVVNDFTSQKGGKQAQDIDKETKYYDKWESQKQSVWSSVMNGWTSLDMRGLRVDEYGVKSIYNSEFNAELNDALYRHFEDVISEFKQSQQNASAWDLSHELIKIKWLIDEVDGVIISAESLESNLKKISDYQCSA